MRAAKAVGDNVAALGQAKGAAWAIKTRWGDVGYHLDVVYELTKKEIKVRYKNSLLGYLWSVLNPLAQAFTFYVAFKLVFRTQIPGYSSYSLFLITGLFPWQWFSNSVRSCARVYLDNASLIRKVAFVRELLPMANVLNDLAHFIFSLPVILIFLWAADSAPTWAWLYGVPAFALCQFLFTFGLGLVTASINLFFRDIDNLVNIALQMWFYFSPIVWHIDMLPADSSVKLFLQLNPLGPLMTAYRELFIHGTFNLRYFFLSLAAGIVIFALGYAIHGKLKWKFAEAL